jgi:hypothetical protein
VIGRHATGSGGAANQVGGALMAIGWGMPGHPDSIRALRVDSQYVGHGVPVSELPPGIRSGTYPNAIRPDFKVAAFPCDLRGAGPTAVCLRDLETGAVSTFARYDGDAAPVGWLPDGSALIVLRGRITADGGYGHELLLVDSGGRVVRTIARDSTTFEGAWSSPLGDRILLLRERDRRVEAAIIGLSGDVQGIVDWCDRSTKATWSPDGLRLACLLEDTHVLRIGPTRTQSWPSHVTLPGPVESGPIWSADGRFIAVSVAGRAPGVYVVDRAGLMEPRRVAPFTVPPRLIAWTGTRTVPPLHKLHVIPDSLTMAVGSTATLETEGLGPQGQLLGPASQVRWYAIDSGIARVGEAGKVVADRPGRTAVVASYGLQRVDDTAWVRVDSAPVRLLLTETFDEGLDTRRWRSFGQPGPEVVAGAGLGRSAGFLNGGTYLHAGGIALRAPLALDRGLTIEYWASVPVTRPLWQSVKVGLYAQPAESLDVGPEGEATPNVAAVSLEAPNPNDARRQMMAVISDANPRLDYVALPRRLADGRWHRYRLVVYPQGEVRWFADGIEAMPPIRAALGDRRLWTLVIAGRSVGTLAIVDDVRVWQGVLLDPVQPQPAAPRTVSPGRNVP